MHTIRGCGILMMRFFFLDSTSETKGESEVFTHGLEGSSAAEPESGESKVDDGSRPDPVSSREHFHREQLTGYHKDPTEPKHQPWSALQFTLDGKRAKSIVGQLPVRRMDTFSS